MEFKTPNLKVKLIEQPDQAKEASLIKEYSYHLEFICSNRYRAGIICLLTNSLPTNHSMKVEDLAYKLGTSHKTVIYHLEILERYKLVTVRRYRNQNSRSVWGLYTKYPNWLEKVYRYILTHCFTLEELKSICNQNKSRR